MDEQNRRRGEMTRYIDDATDLSPALRAALESGDYIRDELLGEFRRVQQDAQPERGWAVAEDGSTEWMGDAAAIDADKKES